MENFEDKHAFLVMSRTVDANLLNLLKSIDYKDNDIYLHIDKKANVKNFNSKLEHAELILCQNISVGWAADTLIKAEMILLKTAVNSGKKYSYLHLMSGNDLQIVDNVQFRKFFKNTDEQYIDYESIDKPINMRRIKYFFPLQQYTGKKHGLLWAMQKILMYIQVMLRINRLRKSPYKHIAKGSAWFSITLECAQYIVKKEKEIEKYFYHGSAADELFIQTLILSSKFESKIASNNLRYIKWSEGANSPEVLKISNYEDLIASQKLFARKFDTKIDSLVISKILGEAHNG